MSEVSEFSENSGSNGMDKVTMIFVMQKNGVRLNEAHSVCVWTDYCQRITLRTVSPARTM